MIVIDDAINPALLRAMAAAWPEERWHGWHRYQSHDSVKLATRDAELMPRAAMPCLLQMVDVVEDRIAEGCFPDWDLLGAGLHAMPPGGHLSAHLDSDVHPIHGWRREYSCVICVNEQWRNNWNGNFVMLGKQTHHGTRLRTPVSPQFNRLMLFRTTDDSLHEVTQVTGPEWRKTLSLFFWSTAETPAKRPVAEFSRHELSYT